MASSCTGVVHVLAHDDVGHCECGRNAWTYQQTVHPIHTSNSNGTSSKDAAASGIQLGTATSASCSTVCSEPDSAART
jgi:hypothetical protein